MIDCNRTVLTFSSLGRRKVVADFRGGSLTSDAGALLLREADRQLGLTAAINACIPDPRHPFFICHQQHHMLAQRMYGIALGYEDLNDHAALRVDPLLQAATERGVDPELPLASTSTLHRLENRIARKSLVDINKLFVEAFLASFKGKAPPKELTLDFDATDDPIHGQQQQRFYHGYYQEYCFLPLYVFCGDQLLTAYLRPANIDPALHAWAILALLVKRFRQVWPEAKIIFRGDGGFCRWRMLRWCDRHQVGYLVGLPTNCVLTKNAQPWTFLAQEQFAITSHKQRIFGEFLYAAGTWDKLRRVLVKAEYLPDGPNTRFVLTNLEGPPQALYDERYCARGEMENRIKEQQLGLFADRTSCHDFLANQFRVLLSAAAYVLLEHIRRVALAGTALAGAQVSTIRVKLLKIGARVVASARRIVLHLPTAMPLRELFATVLGRLLATPAGVRASG